MGKTKFTKHEIETAIRVLMQSRAVKNWVESEAKFLGINLDTPAGKIFFEKQSRAAAERLIK